MTEQRLPLAGTSISFDVEAREMLVITRSEEPAQGNARKPISANEWWDTLMLEPFTFAAGPWHLARGSVAAKLTSGADVNAEGAEMEYGLARGPLMDALRFAIETDIPTMEIFQRINRGAQDMRNQGIPWAELYADAVKAEYNLLKEEIELETSAPH